MEVTNIHTLDLYPDVGLVEGAVRGEGNNFYAVLNPVSGEMTYYMTMLEESEDGENIDISLSDEEQDMIKEILMKTSY